MSVSASDIVFYGSANMQESDTGTQGGAIDLTTKVTFTDISATGLVEILSSNAGDTTQTVTVYGRLASGVIDSEALSLNGTTVVSGAKSFERIMKVVVNAAHTGTITVRKATDDVTIMTLETGILTCRRLFYSATAEASGGSSKDIYEKIFAKNTNGTSALLSAVVKEQADPGANITFDLEDAQNDTNTSTNRISAPSGMLGSFTGSDKNVPGTDILAAGSIGIWLKLTLAAGATPAKNTYTVRLSGSTT
jgi:hypothetical protein